MRLTELHTDAEMFSDLTPEAKQQLGFNGEVLGVTHGLAPHPEELVLKPWEDGEADSVT
jgi:hypothetical protein